MHGFQGNALLVGVGGSGKKSLSKLGAFAAGAVVFEITLTRGYNEESFRDDLKVLYNMLGVENKAVVFLFTDAHVADEGFLELINNMLTSGMVPALFKEDEKDGMIGQVYISLSIFLSHTKNFKNISGILKVSQKLMFG